MTQKYITKRQPTFFPKEVEVTLEQLEEIFTDKAIKAMVEDGFLKKVSKDKEWLDYLDEQIKSSVDTFKNKLVAEVLAFKDKGTKVLLHELREDQLGEVIGEFSYLRKKLGDKIALKVDVPESRELDVHEFFASLVGTFTDYYLLSENGPKRGWIYDTGLVLFVTEIVEETISNCLIITEYK